MKKGFYTLVNTIINTNNTYFLFIQLLKNQFGSFRLEKVNLHNTKFHHFNMDKLLYYPKKKLRPIFHFNITNTYLSLCLNDRVLTILRVATILK